MRRSFLPAMFPKRVAALVGVVVLAPMCYAQAPASVSDSVIVTEDSALGRRLAHDMATTNGTSFMTLGTSGRVVTPKGSNGAVSFARDELTTPRRYFITDLGTLGGTQSFAYAINDLGQVVGEAYTAGDASDHTFLYSNGAMTDLYPLNSQNVLTVGPRGINAAGQIASGVIANGVYVPAVLNMTTGELSLIGSLGGVTSYGFNGVATSINNRGSAVGYSYIDSINRHAFLYNNGAISDIGSFGGYSSATAINDAGVIVGFASDLYYGAAHAFLYNDGVMTNIHPATESYAEDINNNGQVVGEFLADDLGTFHAFLYSQGTFADLGVPGVAYAINDQSQIVGIADDASRQYAFFYENGHSVDLNTVIPHEFGWDISWAFDINNLGQIVGYGSLHSKFRAFVLTPAISTAQCMKDGWKNFGFINEGQCIQFVINGK